MQCLFLVLFPCVAMLVLFLLFAVDVVVTGLLLLLSLQLAVVIVAIIVFCIVVDVVGEVLDIIVRLACCHIGFVLFGFAVCGNAVSVPVGFDEFGNVVVALAVIVI